MRDLLEEAEPEELSRMNSATRVLSGWHQDEEFLDPSGEPLLLPATGDKASFASLCSKYSGGVAPATMLKELKHVGAVKEDEDGMMTVKMRTYMPTLQDPARMLSSGSVLEDMGYTVAHNLRRDEDEPGRFERRATNTRMPVKALPEFREFIEHEGQASTLSRNA